MFIVECCGGKPHTPNFRYFSCHGDVWPQVLQIAREAGWKPLGTKPSESWDRKFWGKDHEDGNYKPADAGKVISEEDAKFLAEALRRSIRDRITFPAHHGPILIVEGMDPEEYSSVNQGISVVLLEKFIMFLDKGAFTFFWDD